MTKAKIEIYVNSFSDDLLETFNTIEELEAYADEFPGLMADQISINGMILLGWDELYDFV